MMVVMKFKIILWSLYFWTKMFVK